MEVRLPLERPIGNRTVLSQYKIKPFLGFLPLQSFKWSGNEMVAKATHGITASSDFSKRRQRKVSNPRSRDSSPKGFTPKTQIPTNIPKKYQKSNDEDDVSGSSSRKKFEEPNAKTPELIFVGDDEENLEMEENLAATQEADGSEYEKFIEEKHVYEGQLHKNVAKDKFKEAPVTLKVGTEMSGETDSRSAEIGKLSKNAEHVKSIETTDDTQEKLYLQSVAVDNHPTTIEKDKSSGELFKKLELDRKKKLWKEAFQRLADNNFTRGNRLFHHPQLVKPDQDVEIFFNRSISRLKDEPEVFIMGAFNGWRWKSFTFKMSKSHLKGDWWSCLVHVPKEAYKIDFVFHNGEYIYDNNNEQDFCIRVEGGIDEFEFENFLLEEKRREQEELARKKAEMERQEEKKMRLEAERIASEADRAQARTEVAKRKGELQQMLKSAMTSMDDVWYMEPPLYGSNDIVKLYYNKSSGPLKHADNIWIHGGHNGWKDGLSIVSKLIKPERKAGDWWFAEVVVPDKAFVLDWVFADDLPSRAKVYDNNNEQDFHGIVPMSLPDDRYWFVQEEEIYERLQAERQLREEALRAKAEKTARLKAETKEKTLKTFLLSQKHIVYTDPLDVQAGSTATLYYNPANTVLRGKPEVWLRCSFNRWTHRFGPLPPQKMVPAENGSHLKATVKVPLDAYMMDFVFSEKENGGVFDNKNGMDYHIPVFGGVVKEPPMHIVHIAVEMAPIAKVGGLGDVVTSLSRAVQDMSHNVDIILPKYDCLNLSNVKNLHLYKSYMWGGTEIKVWVGKVEGLSVYFLEPQNGLFWVGCIYGRHNDGERFGFFCHAALEFLRQSGFHPDIIHCHDWSSAPVAWLFKEQYMHYGLEKARVVFTIHNLEFGAHLIGKAMAFSDKATTVSPTYSKEVSSNPVIASHLHKFHGILNGIDPDIWDPLNDKFIPVCYTSENVVEGKRAAKEALQQRLGLEKADRPLVGIITRLTHQKGIRLIKHAIWRTLDRNGQVVLLGSAPDPRIQNDFVNLANQLHSTHNGRARLCLTYDEPLSHLIYAGADFILVPSIFEPCGLTQLTAMRYGSIPVVRKTGGLFDTVFDVDDDKERAKVHGLEPNGFNFDGADEAGVDYALNRAISAWYDGREWFNSLCKRVMEQDWSWNRPALDYLELYHAARK
ncbi:starch synthase 3, chloroplastic/amyloplastic [Andrographis paniculata]|uniref:starch synthase 3, chloroplastic/amyloplastic n=1 Tax=Andrographis paniculata TaxID=175694 RepID=UPI0021E77A16|nr:starch synthase 3, chloroplastic/amyloplastic [Andrographis paniculata]